MRERIVSALIGGVIGGLIATSVAGSGLPRLFAGAAGPRPQLPQIRDSGASLERIEDPDRGVTCYFSALPNISCVRR
jgi:hypothetical protein